MRSGWKLTGWKPYECRIGLLGKTQEYDTHVIKRETLFKLPGPFALTSYRLMHTQFVGMLRLITQTVLLVVAAAPHQHEKLTVTEQD